MLIALLALLGVDLIVILVFASLVLGRRRWLKRQPGAFVGAIRVTNGTVNGLGTKWKRGTGHWVRDVLVWNPAPLMVWNRFVPLDLLGGEPTAADGEVKRLGATPIIVSLESEDVTIEIASHPDDRLHVVGPFASESTPGMPAKP